MSEIEREREVGDERERESGRANVGERASLCQTVFAVRVSHWLSFNAGLDDWLRGERESERAREKEREEEEEEQTGQC